MLASAQDRDVTSWLGDCFCNSDTMNARGGSRRKGHASLLAARRTALGINIGLAFWTPSARADSVNTVTPASDGPIVHIAGPPSLRLERRTGMIADVGYHWLPQEANVYAPVCSAPCDARVVPGEHRLVGPGYCPTLDFVLEGTGRLELEPDMGSRAFRVVGLASAIAGGVLLLVGSIFYALGRAGQGNNPHGFDSSGAVLMPVGALALAIPMLLASTSSVTIHEAPQPHQARFHMLPGGFAF
jgi:hypothetical protein